MVMSQRRLPVGTSAFRNIRRRGFYYVDKTPHLHQLIEEGEYWFLSRPRRFGKTLLVDTLHELFEGNEELFRGLHIHPRWDWETRYPVVRLSFDNTYQQPGELAHDIRDQLERIEQQSELPPAPAADSGPRRLRKLIHQLADKTGQQVVVLVDEYDKPILDVLETPELALAHRDSLRGLYGILKGCARYLRFVFVTGISMYSRVSLFSNLNNLNDLSLVPRYATICGYTETDLETVFAPELEGVSAKDRARIRRWYNGYSWLGKEKVYNPFDILLYFQNRKFLPYWYQTGTPHYLYRQLAQGTISTLDLSHLELPHQSLSHFEPDRIHVNALLFQCGYLTLVKEKVRGSRLIYTLDYPNHEVRLALNEELLTAVSGEGRKHSAPGRQWVEQLEAQDFEGFTQALKALFAGIPYQWQERASPPHEGFYATLLYAGFFTEDFDIRAEESTRWGRSDLVLVRPGQVFVFECKVAQNEADVERRLNEAMGQMREKGYADKYRTPGQVIHRLALVFDREQHQLAAWRAEKA